MLNLQTNHVWNGKKAAAMSCTSASAQKSEAYLKHAGKVMQLLAALYTAGLSQEEQQRLPEVLPRSWPLFRHPLSSVRTACVDCLAAFASALGSSGSSNSNGGNLASTSSQWLHSNLLTMAVRLLFQNVLVEEHVGIRQASQGTLQRLVQHCQPADLQQAVPEALAQSFLKLAGVPSGLPWPPGSLVEIPKDGCTKSSGAQGFAGYPKYPNGELAADIRVAASTCLACIAAALPAGDLQTDC